MEHSQKQQLGNRPCIVATASEQCEPETLNQRVPGKASPVSDPGYGREWISLTGRAISPLSVGGQRAPITAVMNKLLFAETLA